MFNSSHKPVHLVLFLCIFLVSCSASEPHLSNRNNSASPTTVSKAILIPAQQASPVPTQKASPAPARKNILVPAQGALLGHYYGNGTLHETDALIGRKPSIHLNYYAWEDDWTSGTTQDDFTQGRIPLVNWEPYNISFEDIIRGREDSTIRARANGAKKLTRKFFLDFAAEMNGDVGWGNHVPARYIAAYRRIHDLFQAVGATNVIWVWCPNQDSIAGGPAALAYYPGDNYVDWTCADGYNWGTSDPNDIWQSFYEVFADIYTQLATKGKPILIGETASDEVGGSKAHWIAEIVPTLRSNFPLIKALVWFDIDKERHWQINSSPSALLAYARMAADPYMNPHYTPPL